MPRKGGSSSCLPADFTGHPSFHLDDIGGAGESQAPQNSLPALQLVHLQDGLSFLQLPLGCSDICSDLERRQAKERGCLYSAAREKTSNLV